ncbi:MAG: hypothetical protein AAGI14_03790 [Pseudomonadota bacterium]
MVRLGHTLKVVPAFVLMLVALPWFGSAQDAKTEIAVKIAATSMNVRALGITDPMSITETYAARPDELRVFDLPDLSDIHKELFWRSFFSNAQVHIAHAYSSTPITAYYNPLIEGFLLLQWDARGPVPTLTDIRVLWAEDLIASDLKGHALPGWLRRLANESIVTALPDRTRTVMSAFEATYPSASSADIASLPGQSGTDAQIRLVERLDLILMGLVRLSQEGWVEAHFSEAKQAIEMGDRLFLSDQLKGRALRVAETSLEMPELYRGNLIPAFALKQDGQWLILSSSPQNGRFYILTVFGDATSGQPLQMVAALDALTEETTP